MTCSIRIDSALRHGSRGLPGGSSLAHFLESNFGIRNEKNLPDFNESLIVKWVKQYHKKHGKYPNQMSGDIEFATDKFKGDTCRVLSNALSKGNRGLPGGSSLAEFLEQEFGIRYAKSLPDFNESQIVKWIKQYHDKHRKYSNNKSGKIEFVTEKFEGDTWATVDDSLRIGLRGLPGGSSLAKFIKFLLENTDID